MFPLLIAYVCNFFFYKSYMWVSTFKHNLDVIQIVDKGYVIFMEE